jgi:hypothetical protein
MRQFFMALAQGLTSSKSCGLMDADIVDAHRQQLEGFAQIG